MARLILSGGGLGIRADAWPEALEWLANAPSPLVLASLASRDEQQATVLASLLGARGVAVQLFKPGASDPTEGTIFLCGGDATLLATDAARAAQLRRWVAQPDLTVIADSASAMALGRFAASCTCGGHPIRTVAGLGLLGEWSVLAHAEGPDDSRLAALRDSGRPEGGRQLPLRTGEAVEVLGDVSDPRFGRMSWSRR